MFLIGSLKLLDHRKLLFKEIHLRNTYRRPPVYKLGWFFGATCPGHPVLPLATHCSYISGLRLPVTSKFDKMVKNFESTCLHLQGDSRVSEPDLNIMSCVMPQHI